jgi:ABC-type uncharacterized transport system fused permease/ATPase subunit
LVFFFFFFFCLFVFILLIKIVNKIGMLCNTYLTEDIHIKWMINHQFSRLFQLDSISQL